MTLGILGKKIGMTQIFDQKGNVIPVTIIKSEPCIVTQIKLENKCGYNAIQIGYEELLPDDPIVKGFRKLIAAIEGNSKISQLFYLINLSVEKVLNANFFWITLYLKILIDLK